MSDQNKSNLPAGRQGNLSTLILGVAIGAALTYLFTTKKGQKIKDKLLTEGQSLLEEIGEKVSAIEEEILDKEEETHEKLVEGAKEIEEKIEEAVEEIPEHIEQLQKRGRKFFFRRHQSPES